MSKVNVKTNDYLNQGDIIGEVGSTGRVTGPHLHWTVYLSKERINPESLLVENFEENLFNWSQDRIKTIFSLGSK